MTFKKAIGFIHLWLGLISGLVVFIIAITGCIYAFQVEIQDVTQSYKFVEEQKKDFLLPSQLEVNALKALPGKKIHSVEYKGKHNAAQIAFYQKEPEYYYVVYLNPYTGKVLKVKDMENGFFDFILEGHFYLWLPHEIGQPIVASATLIFVVMMITGIIMWWPKNKGAVKQRFTVKWNARWRRKNYDLHYVLGFYMSWFVIFIALTGLVWGFQWFSKTVYWTTSGGKEMVKYYQPNSDTTNVSSAGLLPVDNIWLKLNKENPNAQVIEVHYPEENKSTIAASINPDAKTYLETDYRYFDRYTLKELSVDHIWGRYNKDAIVADKLMRMNYDIHVGAIWGLPGKILAFSVSLIVASLPITGFMLWWGRRNKKKKITK